MPKLPRDIRQAEAVGAFIRMGGQERKGKGSHRVVKMPNGLNLSIPSGSLKVGLLRDLIQKSESSVEEFLKAAGR